MIHTSRDRIMRAYGLRSSEMTAPSAAKQEGLSQSVSLTGPYAEGSQYCWPGRSPHGPTRVDVIREHVDMLSLLLNRLIAVQGPLYESRKTTVLCTSKWPEISITDIIHAIGTKMLPAMVTGTHGSPRLRIYNILNCSSKLTSGPGCCAVWA